LATKNTKSHEKNPQEGRVAAWLDFFVSFCVSRGNSMTFLDEWRLNLQVLAE
jgi:hypothetical protein